MNKTNKLLEKLVDAQNLMATLWEPSSRPGLRTIRRWQKNGTIPYVRIGRSVFFDPADVRENMKQFGKKCKTKSG